MRNIQGKWYERVDRPEEVGDLVEITHTDSACSSEGNIGEVTREREGGSIGVDFNGFNNPNVFLGGKWAIPVGYFNVLEPAAEAKVGDVIEVTKVGSANSPFFSLGEVGIVTGVESDGDIIVDFGDEIDFAVERMNGDDYRLMSKEPKDVESQKMSDKYPKYYKDVSDIDAVDIYKIHELFDIDDPSGAIHHASKKLLLSGVRTGGKSKYDDIKEARDTLTRWLDMNEGY